MTDASRRFLLLSGALLGAVLLLAGLLLVFAQPPIPVATPDLAASPTPYVVATVDGKPVLLSEWQEAVAVDQAMSALTGQPFPSPDETLDRLINERLVLREADSAGIPRAKTSEAEDWLTAIFLPRWNLDPGMLEQTLDQVGLKRAILVDKIIPRLLRVQAALDQIPPEGEGGAWVSDLRRQAQVELLDNLYALPLPTPAGAVDEPPSASEPSISSPTLPNSGPQVGDLAPDFGLGTVDGTTIRLTDLRGQLVLLNFWATWCARCREELPLLQAGQSPEPVVLAVAVRESAEAVQAYGAELGLRIPLLPDQSGRVSDLYRVRGLPTSLLIDRTGVVIARHVGPLTQTHLDEYLSSLTTTPEATPTP
jgi:peroxiredoxin